MRKTLPVKLPSKTETSLLSKNSNFRYISYGYRTTYEPQEDKTNKVACPPSEDSDQPVYLPSLIRVFAVRMKKAWVLSYPLSAQ